MFLQVSCRYFFTIQIEMSRDVFRAFVGTTFWIIHDRIMIVYIIFASFIILRVGFSYLHSEAYNLPVVELG
jgi:hypothetical protein